MGIDYDHALIAGYILPENEYNDEDKVEEIATKLKCEFVPFNFGYDDPFHYALVPKGFKKDMKIDLTDPDALNLIVIAVHKIKERADALGIKLPSPVITSQLCVW
jgi:hypothetical protein